jgi:hypothetical protein
LWNTCNKFPFRQGRNFHESYQIFAQHKHYAKLWYGLFLQQRNVGDYYTVMLLVFIKLHWVIWFDLVLMIFLHWATNLQV